MVIDRSENFLGRDKQRRHLPYGHFEVHLRELEQSGQQCQRPYPGHNSCVLNLQGMPNALKP